MGTGDRDHRRRAGQNRLIVVIELVNDGAGEVDPLWASAEYVAPDGQQVTAAYAQGATPLRAGASTVAALSFGEQELGGTVYVPVWADGNTDEELAFDLEAR